MTKKPEPYTRTEAEQRTEKTLRTMLATKKALSASEAKKRVRPVLDVVERMLNSASFSSPKA